MKLLHFLLGLLACLNLCFAWDKFDHEIFDLVSEIEADGHSSFYDWLQVPSTASTSEIAKSYRKLSMQLHPDKNPNVKGAHERFARLGKVSTLLRKEDTRTYDFFYKNGVPKWRGTGYYYSRFRPGVGTVLTFLAILTSGLQYIVQKMNYKRDIARIERFIGEARLAAWGPKLNPLTGQRKVKVNLGGGPRLDNDGNISAGRWIEMIVNEQDVYILDPSGETHLLDRDAATRPAVLNTWVFSLIKAVFGKIKGKTIDKPSAEETFEAEMDDSEGISDTTSETPGSGTVTPTGTKPTKAKKRKNLKKR